VTLADLPPAIHGGPAPAPAAPEAAPVAPGGTAEPLPTLAEAERDLIGTALRKAGGNKNEAARLLGIDRQRLYRKIEKYGL
jgi:DNA-binding NtrC family response regulator